MGDVPQSDPCAPFSCASDETLSDIVEELADEAALWTTIAICRRTEAASDSLPGVRGRLQTRQDIHFELLFLVGALATGEPALFADYICWLARTMRNRGAPAANISEALVLIRTFFDQRLDAAKAARVSAVIDAGLSALDELADADSPPHDPPVPPCLPETEALTLRLIAGDIAGARELMLQAHAATNDYLRVGTRLIQPAMYAIGRMWEQNRITVGQEHLATVICQTLLAQLYLTASFPEPHDRKVLFACVEGNHHALGLRMAADAFELSGWSLQFLGGNVPLDSLLAQVDRWQPEIVGLSAAMVQHLPALRRSTDAVRGDFAGRRPTIMVGGLATNRNDQIWRWIGADVWCGDAEQALILSK